MPAPEPTRGGRIGVLGGTFDPPHIGHVAAGRAAVAVLDLDRLLLVVANDPWQKSPGRDITPAEDRLAMTEVMAAEIPRAEVSRIEIDRGGPSYSVDTATELLARTGSPPPGLYLVVGADLLGGLDSWERADELKALVTVAAVSRPSDPTPIAPPGWRVVRVDGPQVDVSSSEVRHRLERGESVADAVPGGVIRCIAQRGLYAVGR